MRISELIQELQEIQAVEGDLYVWTATSDCEHYPHHYVGTATFASAAIAGGYSDRKCVIYSSYTLCLGLLDSSLRPI